MAPSGHPGTSAAYRLQGVLLAGQQDYFMPDGEGLRAIGGPPRLAGCAVGVPGTYRKTLPARQRKVSSLPGLPSSEGCRCSGQICHGKSTSSLAHTRVVLDIDDQFEADLLQHIQPEVATSIWARSSGVMTMPGRP